MAADQIVILDAATLDFNDQSFSEWKKLGRLKVYRETAPHEISKRIRAASIVITNKCAMSRKILLSARKLRFIAVAATGVNIIDLETARERNIAVTNVAGYSTPTVVQFTMLFILALFSRYQSLDRRVRKGDWVRSSIFTVAEPGITELSGKTLGIIGYGTIGKQVATAAEVLGMKTSIALIPGKTYASSERKKRRPLQEVLRHSDAVSIHAPLTELTRNLIDARAIRMMKRGSYLINMARGGIVNEPDLKKALERGHLAGAASDVLTEEPPSKKHVLLNAPNFLLTPHVGWASVESRRRLIHELALNIKAFQQGRKRNRLV